MIKRFSLIFEKNKVDLFFISFFALFLELTLIRFLPAYAMSLWYFSNIILIAAFLGLGIGALIADRKDIFRWFPLALLISIIFFVFIQKIETIIPYSSSEVLWTYYYFTNYFSHSAIHLGIFTTIAIIFVIVAGLFVFIGQKIAILMKTFTPLKAYGVDLLGALMGVIIFSLITFKSGQTDMPIIWFSVICLIVLYMMRNVQQVIWASILSISVLMIVWYSSSGSIWSPYYSIQTKDQDGLTQVFVNRFFHQQILDSHTLRAVDKYFIPYYFKSDAKTVLVLGAGTGNDVSIALDKGAEKIDAVEIDKQILYLGKKFNPNHPYSDPRVKVIIDDARSFLKQTDNKYDLIIFGTLDSHALLSAMTTIRLDNFVYTVESLKEARARLSENGVVALLFSSPTKQFTSRLLSIAREAFAGEKMAAYISDDELFNTFFVAGPGLMSEKTIDNIKNGEIAFIKYDFTKQEGRNFPTDNWPYLYLFKHGIPSHYLKIILILCIISLIGIFSTKKIKSIGYSGLNFFLLGTAFLLLETKSISSLSLVFGSTWLVNSFVFGSIILALLFANILVSKIEIKRVWWIYIMLLLSIVINFFIPPASFVGFGYLKGGFLSSLVSAVPVFFSAIIFSFHFKTISQDKLPSSYGLNLIGAVFGGFLEYSSMLFGLRALFIIIAILYTLSYFVYKIKLSKFTA